MHSLYIDIWLSLIVFWYMMHLLLIDELPSSKCQHKLIGQLVLWRYSIFLKCPKLEVGEGNHCVLTRIQHYLIQKKTDNRTNLINTFRLRGGGWGGTDNTTKYLPLIVDSDLQNTSPRRPLCTHPVDTPLVLFPLFHQESIR